MKDLGDRLKRAAKAFVDPTMGGSRYALVDRTVQCSHCGGEEFTEGSAQLNTAGMTFIGLDWVNESATTLVCNACGKIDWFLQKPDKL